MTFLKDLPRAILRRLVLWPIAPPESWEIEFDELKQNVEELIQHSNKLMSRVPTIRAYVGRALAAGNDWAFWMGLRKIDQLLDQVESNNLYVSIGNQRMKELLTIHVDNLDLPL